MADVQGKYNIPYMFTVVGVIGDSLKIEDVIIPKELYAEEADDHNLIRVDVIAKRIMSDKSEEIEFDFKDGGVLVKNKVFLVDYKYNALVVTQDKHSEVYTCVLCRITLSPEDKEEHVVLESHIERLNKSRFISEYEENCIRQISDEEYHCGCCNTINSDPKSHIQTSFHGLHLQQAMRLAAGKPEITIPPTVFHGDDMASANSEVNSTTSDIKSEDCKDLAEEMKSEDCKDLVDEKLDAVMDKTDTNVADIKNAGDALNSVEAGNFWKTVYNDKGDAKNPIEALFDSPNQKGPKDDSGFNSPWAQSCLMPTDQKVVQQPIGSNRAAYMPSQPPKQNEAENLARNLANLNLTQEALMNINKIIEQDQIKRQNLNAANHFNTTPYNWNLNVQNYPNFRPNFLSNINPNFNPNFAAPLNLNINPNVAAPANPNFNSKFGAPVNPNLNPNFAAPVNPNLNPSFAALVNPNFAMHNNYGNHGPGSNLQHHQNVNSIKQSFNQRESHFINPNINLNLNAPNQYYMANTPIQMPPGLQPVQQRPHNAPIGLPVPPLNTANNFGLPNKGQTAQRIIVNAEKFNKDTDTNVNISLLPNAETTNKTDLINKLTGKHFTKNEEVRDHLIESIFKQFTENSVNVNKLTSSQISQSDIEIKPKTQDTTAVETKDSKLDEEVSKINKDAEEINFDRFHFFGESPNASNNFELEDNALAENSHSPVGKIAFLNYQSNAGTESSSLFSPNEDAKGIQLSQKEQSRPESSDTSEIVIITKDDDYASQDIFSPTEGFWEHSDFGSVTPASIAEYSEAMASPWNSPRPSATLIFSPVPRSISSLSDFPALQKKQFSAVVSMKPPEAPKTVQKESIPRILKRQSLYIVVTVAKKRYMVWTNNYHTLVDISENWYCILCDRTIAQNSKDVHIASAGHRRLLAEHPMKEEYGANLIRILDTDVHCSVCNILTLEHKLSDHIERHKPHRMQLNEILANSTHAKVSAQEAIDKAVTNYLATLTGLVEETVLRQNQSFDKSIIINVFNVNFKILYLAYNCVVRYPGCLRCVICYDVLRGPMVFNHCEDGKHQELVKRLAFRPEHGNALIRVLNIKSVHCGICNSLQNNESHKIAEHVKSKGHKTRLTAALTFDPSGLTRYLIPGTLKLPVEKAVRTVTPAPKPLVPDVPRPVSVASTSSRTHAEKKPKNKQGNKVQLKNYEECLKTYTPYLVTYNGRTVLVPYASWHCISAEGTSAYCHLCAVAVTDVRDHASTMSHEQELMAAMLVESDHFVKELNDGMYCVTCDAMFARRALAEHCSHRRHLARLAEATTAGAAPPDKVERVHLGAVVEANLDMLRCLLCGKLLQRCDMEEHVSGCRHAALAAEKGLLDVAPHLVRRLKKDRQCLTCNVIVKTKQLEHHLNSQSHLVSLENAQIKAVNDWDGDYDSLCTVDDVKENPEDANTVKVTKESKKSKKKKVTVAKGKKIKNDDKPNTKEETVETGTGEYNEEENAPNNEEASECKAKIRYNFKVVQASRKQKILLVTRADSTIVCSSCGKEVKNGNYEQHLLTKDHITKTAQLFSELKVEIPDNIKRAVNENTDKMVKKYLKVMGIGGESGTTQGYNLPLMGWHSLSYEDGVVKCAVCEVVVEQMLNIHVNLKGHIDKMKSCPVEASADSVVRKLNQENNHCITCNVVVESASWKNHIQEDTHKKLYQESHISDTGENTDRAVIADKKKEEEDSSDIRKYNHLAIEERADNMSRCISCCEDVPNSIVRRHLNSSKHKYRLDLMLGMSLVNRSQASLLIEPPPPPNVRELFMACFSMQEN